jgi:prolyl 4-hydroxylase
VDAKTETKPKFDPNNDPEKLAQIGVDVAQKLERNRNVIKVDAPDIQLYVYQDFLKKRDCRILIDKIDAHAVPSTLYKGTEQPGFRTSSSCHLNRHDLDIKRIETRMTKVIGIDNNYAETMQGQRYHVGQEFKAHHDFFHTSQDYWLKEGPMGGQRTWTAMIFLNNVKEGGATEFPHIKIGVRPQAGTLLIWNNMNPDGTMNYKTLHSGTPVLAGSKYIITKWYRQNEWLTINDPPPPVIDFRSIG